MSQANGVLDLGDQGITEVSVRFRGKDYLLREASSQAACRFRDAMMRTTKVDDGKVVGYSASWGEAEMLLVSQCIFQKHADNGQWVPLGGNEQQALLTIRQWPQAATQKLLDKVRDISGMNDMDTEEIVEKRIEMLTKQLEALRRKSKPDPTATGPSATMATTGPQQLSV